MAIKNWNVVDNSYANRKNENRRNAKNEVRAITDLSWIAIAVCIAWTKTQGRQFESTLERKREAELQKQKDEQDRKKQAEIERQLEKQRQIEQQKDEERRKLFEQREVNDFPKSRSKKSMDQEITSYLSIRRVWVISMRKKTHSSRALFCVMHEQREVHLGRLIEASTILCLCIHQSTMRNVLTTPFFFRTGDQMSSCVHF